MPKSKFQKSLNQLHIGDHKVLARKIPDNSIDLIFTDPPYPHENEHVYPEMMDYAARILKPGGSLMTLCGHYQLHRVIMAALGYGLQYYWVGWMRQPASTTLMGKRVVCTGKPMLWFTKGPRPNFVWGFWWDGYYQGVREKAFHEWQQSLGWGYHSMRNLTKPGDIVLDPFCGGGTIPCAAIALSRQWLSFELNPDTAAIANERINNFFTGPLIVEEESPVQPTVYTDADYRVLDERWKQLAMFDPYSPMANPVISSTSEFAVPGSEFETPALLTQPMEAQNPFSGLSLIEPPSESRPDGHASSLADAPFASVDLLNAATLNESSKPT